MNIINIFEEKNIMIFRSTIHLLQSNHVGSESIRYSSAILYYDIIVGSVNPDGHYIKLAYNKKVKGTIENSERETIDISEFNLIGLEKTSELKEGDFMKWKLDINNKLIVLC